jgi:hypothetical protein
MVKRCVLLLEKKFLLMQYSAFISSGAEETPGILVDIKIEENQKDFFALVRLV